MVAQTFLSEPADKNVCATERDKTKENEYSPRLSNHETIAIGAISDHIQSGYVHAKIRII